MAVRRLLALVTGVAAAAASLPVYAAVGSVDPTAVKVSHGVATIQTDMGIGTAVLDGAAFDIKLTGSLAVHNWTYSGTLRGGSSFGGAGNIYPFVLSSDDQSVRGDCGGQRTEDESENVNQTPRSLGDLSIDCVFTHGGGIPWQIVLRTQTVLSGASTSNLVLHQTYSGVYDSVEIDSALNDDGTQPTYGDAQFTYFGDRYDGERCGPLRLSGRLQIGSVAYTGDLSSDVSDLAEDPNCPALNISGSSGGVDVTGTCVPTPEPFDAVGSSTGVVVQYVWDLSCELQANGGASVSVPLRATFTSRASRGDGYSYGWADYSGTYTAG